MLGLATALAELPVLLDARGLLETAAAQSLDLTAATRSPGWSRSPCPATTRYSVAQGESFAGPGGIAAGAVEALIRNLDQYVAGRHTGRARRRSPRPPASPRG